MKRQRSATPVEHSVPVRPKKRARPTEFLSGVTPFLLPSRDLKLSQVRFALPTFFPPSHSMTQIGNWGPRLKKHGVTLSPTLAEGVTHVFIADSDVVGVDDLMKRARPRKARRWPSEVPSSVEWIGSVKYLSDSIRAMLSKGAYGHR
jgi:hypothetical protein